MKLDIEKDTKLDEHAGMLQNNLSNRPPFLFPRTRSLIQCILS